MAQIVYDCDLTTTISPAHGDLTTIYSRGDRVTMLIEYHFREIAADVIHAFLLSQMTIVNKHEAGDILKAMASNSTRNVEWHMADHTHKQGCLVIHVQLARPVETPPAPLSTCLLSHRVKDTFDLTTFHSTTVQIRLYLDGTLVKDGGIVVAKTDERIWDWICVACCSAQAQPHVALCVNCAF